MLVKHVTEVVLNTASAMQPWVDKTELQSGSGSVCNEFGMRLYSL